MQVRTALAPQRRVRQYETRSMLHWQEFRVICSNTSNILMITVFKVIRQKAASLSSRPIYYIVPWTHVGHPPKLRSDRFSRFCRAYKRDQQTDTHTDRPRYSVCINRPHLMHWFHAMDLMIVTITCVQSNLAKHRITPRLKSAPSRERYGPPPNTWFFGPN